jgi:hypothetical protein
MVKNMKNGRGRDVIAASLLIKVSISPSFYQMNERDICFEQLELKKTGEVMKNTDKSKIRTGLRHFHSDW